MAFIETRIDEMLRIWGKSDLTVATVTVPVLERVGEAGLLNGPALPGEAAVSQGDIDAMFS